MKETSINMFTFHKPRVYRSTEGCCICRAKSSSSRFTDSKKYEFDFMKCFDLKQPRYGEICNACVLLVKRYKRLPAGSNRHWGHVVDARAGPGTKSLTKHKRLRDESADASNVNGGGHSSTYNGKPLISEKFSKIFKKNKKLKSNSQSPTAAPSACNTKRKSESSSASYSWNNTHCQNAQSLPNSPDSFDSDYEDDHIATSNSNMVEFQTQTRASTYRSRTGNNINAAASCFDGGTQSKRAGSMRRKCLLPRKRSSAIVENNVQFFDENEWQQQQSCCGPVYECATLGGAIIVDMEFYKPCFEHQRKCKAKEMLQNQVSLNISESQFQLPQQKEHQQQEQKQQQQQMQSQKTIVDPSSAITKPTQVLKKHHLFFKRQSELFPHSDLSSIQYETCSNNQIQITSATAAPGSKPDLPKPITYTTMARAPVDSVETSIPTMASTNINTNTSTSITIPLTSRHSISKLASHSPAPAVLPYTNINVNKVTSNVLHKIKTTDAGKISKHSLEKINTAAVRILPADLNDMRQILKTVDRSYLLSKSHQQQQTAAAAMPVNIQQQQQNHISIVAPNQLTLNATKLSPTLTVPSTISSCSMAPKFSDNSSDSGFDENLQDRKSASPLQEDTDIKILTRPNIPNGKKIFSTGGVNTYCSAQSMPLQPGIDEANKLRQQYRQHALPISAHQRNYQNRTSGVKIAQIIGGNCNSGGANNNNYNNTSHKLNMRAHAYNNNTIKHENGVTTIVPASSLTASSQAATLSALAAPNTVTITPSPIASINANFKKGAPGGAGIVCGTVGGGGLTMTTASATTPLNTISNHNNNTPNFNQKIIFVKTTKYNNNNSICVTSPAAAAAAAGSTQIAHNAINCHGTTMMATATTTAITPPLPLSAATTPTLNNVLSCGSAQQQNVCVKIDCNT